VRPAGRVSSPGHPLHGRTQSHQSARSARAKESERGIKRRAVWDKRGKPRKERRARGSRHPRAAVVAGGTSTRASQAHLAILTLASTRAFRSWALERALGRPARLVASCASSPSHLLATSLLMMAEGEVFLFPAFCWFKKLRIGSF